MKPTRLFICYRREDTLDFAGRLHDRLSARYGGENVVLDVDNVPIGVHFQKYLDSQIEQCDLLLALIGRHWLEAADPKGARRLDSPRDFVRIEIESALRRELPIIPILVGGAAMPRETDLPPSLAALSEINAAEMASNRDFNVHVDVLIKAIDALVNEATKETVLAPSPAVVAPPEVVTPGEQLLEALKRKLDKLRPKTTWVWKNYKGWWSARERDGARVVIRARIYRNLIRIRVRKNNDRPLPPDVKLSYGDWIAESPESFVRDERQLSILFKQVKAEWG